MAGESHMEETCAAEAVPNCMRQTGTIAVRVSIPVCSQSDSKAWRRQPNAAYRQVSDPTLDFPNAIALPRWGRDGVGVMSASSARSFQETEVRRAEDSVMLGGVHL